VVVKRDITLLLAGLKSQRGKKKIDKLRRHIATNRIRSARRA